MPTKRAPIVVDGCSAGRVRGASRPSAVSIPCLGENRLRFLEGTETLNFQSRKKVKNKKFF